VSRIVRFSTDRRGGSHPPLSRLVHCAAGSRRLRAALRHAGMPGSGRCRRGEPARGRWRSARST